MIKRLIKCDRCGAKFEELPHKLSFETCGRIDLKFFMVDLCDNCKKDLRDILKLYFKDIKDQEFLDYINQRIIELTHYYNDRGENKGDVLSSINNIT